MVKAFLEAEKLRRKRDNAMAWLQGAYVYDAIGRLVPILHPFPKKGTKAEPYLSMPYGEEKSLEDMTEEEREIAEENELKKERIRMLNMRIAGSKWGK